MTPTRGWIENLVLRIQIDYLEHPALTLTLPAAQTRFGLDEAACAGVLRAMVEAGVLTERARGYSRHFPRLFGRRAA